MAVIHELLSRVDNEELRTRLEEEINKISKQKKFGLVFEEHLPECTPLYDIPVKKGAVVAKKNGNVSDMYEVASIQDNLAYCIHQTGKETECIPINELVCVAQFGEPIYPYLQPLDSVCNAPDSNLWHTLIEADNYHALQLLKYLYSGKVDCIYIDPPYNTRDKDWKYNNDYVDSADMYKHSKWLSMMEKRLKLAKSLLNPKESVLIVTIDEKEYLHLGCLLEELFSEANIQMVSNVISRKGSMRRNEFSRCVEYIYFVMIGDASPADSTNDMSGTGNEANNAEPVTWQYLKRRGTSLGASRKGRPGLFYPIFINRLTGTFHSVGTPPPIDIDRRSILPPDGCWAAWPLRPNGEEGVWQVQPSRLLEQLDDGTCYLSSVDEFTETAQFLYLKNQDRQKVLSGKVKVLGKEPSGKLILEKEEGGKTVRPKDVWVVESHDATHGSNLLNTIFVNKRFSYPKSLFAEKDSINFFVGNKPNALILDFFAGSGTTLHAVNLLNAEDGGHRRCILVTNNEVSASEAKELTSKGFHPGDAEWDRLGIARYVTWPRTVCSILGTNVDGKPLDSDYGTYHSGYVEFEETLYDENGKECKKNLYIKKDKICDNERLSQMKMSDGFKANAVFFKLGFLDKTSISLGRQLVELFPVLWMKAGAVGPCPTPKMDELNHYWLSEDNRMGVLIDSAYFADFARAVNSSNKITTVFIITDYEAEYQTMRNNLQVKETYQLYRDYLDNFRINQRR